MRMLSQLFFAPSRVPRKAGAGAVRAFRAEPGIGSSPRRQGRGVKARWKVVVAVLCLWLPAVTLPAWSQANGNAAQQTSYDLHIPLTDQERAYLAGLPPLRIGMDPDWPPYAFVDARGNPSGISADYLKYIVHSLHIKTLRVESKSWSDAIRLANGGKVDVLIAMSPDNKLTVPFLLTESYIDYPEVIITRKSTPPLVDIRSLDGLRVAMVEDDGLKTAPGLGTSSAFHRVSVNTVQKGLQIVADGEADAFIGNLGVVERLIREHYAGVLYVSGATGYSQSLGFGVAPGYEPLRELMDRVLKAVPEEDRERIQNTWLSTYLQYGVPRRTLWEVLTPIGIVVLVSIVILSFIIAYLRKEIRRRHVAEQELYFQVRFLQSLMATAPIPVFVKDPQGRYMAVNAAFENLVGLKANVLIGKTAGEVHPQKIASNDQLELLTKQALSTGQLVQGELQYCSNSGEMHDVMYWLQQISEEKEQPRALLGVLADVSALRAMERDQRRQAEYLAHAKQEAEQASRVKDVFLATMSHEIRTPMSGVIGVLDLMGRRRLHADDQHLLDMARSAARTLLRILNDLLDFSKSESGKLTIESQPFSLRAIVNEVVGLFSPEMQRKGLRFDVFVSALVAPCYIGDGQRLAQVLMNLVGNALKFTDNGGIGVVVEALPIDVEAKTQSLTITVRDTGIGIDETEQVRLFEPFVQVGTQHQGGTGLGLAICKRLVQAMNGHISLRSAVQKGTSVEVALALPIDADTAYYDEEIASALQDDIVLSSQAVAKLPITNRAILLVEDQPINRELLVRQLHAVGVQAFDVATNGLEAWRLYEKHAYELVITDCAMPGMDGEELIRRIRARKFDKGRRPYLVALTANVLETQRQSCLDAGADDVLVKPVSLDQLRALLTHVFGIPAPAMEQTAQLPEGIPVAEWPNLRERILADMGDELSIANEAIGQQNWKRAWQAVHRILGIAKWFKLSDIASSALTIQAALDEGRTADVFLAPLEDAIAALAGQK